MNAVEDRLRDAYRALADTVDPAGAPGLTVSTGPRVVLSRRMRFVSALAAAAAVTLVAVIAVIPEGIPPGHHHAKTALLPATPEASNPAFVLVDKGLSLVVYSTRTGLGVATLTAPRGQQFEDVASGGTTRTFLAASGLAGAACRASFYRFELSASGKPSRLAFLRSVPGSQPTAVAPIPGGGYAYSTVHCATAPPDGAIGISGPGRSRTWAYDQGDDYAVSLAATADGHTLAFSLVSPSGSMLLNTSSRFRTVDSASRILRSVPVSATLAISPGGQTLYACAKGTLAAYSTATGAQIRVLRRWPDRGASCQVSLDPTGRFLLAAVTSGLDRPSALIGFDLHTGTSVTLPVHPVLHFYGTQLAW